MDAIKKIAGYLWILLGPGTIAMLFYRATQEIFNAKPDKMQETMMFWVITIIIFVPIALGLTLFGMYASKGEYDSNN
ncbi:MAG: hypothetical protein EAZ55_02475 [Cytophagales bacterium]|nr:MAG: hypothetical protein EAZ55_02475 [Cytophagales bacterium]